MLDPSLTPTRLIGWVALILLAHALLLVIALIGRTYPDQIKSIAGGQLLIGLTGLVPRLDAQATTVVTLAEMFLFTRLRALRRWLRSKDTRPHAGSKAF